MLLLQFAAVAGVIVFAGWNLSKHGDVIAEKTGLGRTWVGVIRMASVTSLPELITGVSSVAIFDLPNIAMGDIFGSCMFNLLILAGLDVFSHSTPISAKAHQGHVPTASFGVLMLGMAVIRISAGQNMPAIGWIGAPAFVKKEEASVQLWSIAVQQAAVFDPVRVKLETSLKEAADLMLRWHVGGLPVVDDHENVVGVITYTDILREFVGRE
jgi:CBS domain-containing protein